MPIYEFPRTIGGGASQTLIIGRVNPSTGWFNGTDIVLADARQVFSPFVGGFSITVMGSVLDCSKPSSTLLFNGKYEYTLTVTNRGPGPISFILRIWVPIAL